MHLFIKQSALKVCEKCKAMIKPHTVCPSCGYYKGREVVDVLSRLDRKERKLKEREMKDAQKESKKEPVAER